MEIKISELRLIQITRAGASVHARKDYPVKPGPIIVAAGPDGNPHVVGNMGKFIAQKKKSINGTIDAETLDIPDDDPRISRIIGLDLFDAPMSADEASRIINYWKGNCKKAVSSGIINSEAEWPRPPLYGLIPSLFDAYQEGKLKSAQARIVQKLPHDAQELIAASNDLKRSPGVFETLLETYNTEGMETFKALLDNPATINDIAIRQTEDTATTPVETSLPALSEEPPDDIDLETINVTSEMKQELNDEVELIKNMMSACLNTLTAVARGLTSIYTRNLYAAADYASFGKYCHDTFGIEPRQAYRIVQKYRSNIASKELKRLPGLITHVKDIKEIWAQIELLADLSDDQKEAITPYKCAYLEDGTQVDLDDFRAMTKKEQDVIIEGLKNKAAAAQQQLAQAEEKYRHELEKQKDDNEFMTGELQASINSLNKKITETNKQIADLQSQVQKKDDLIKDMATKAHEQQEIGAKQERKKIDKETEKINSKIKSLQQEGEKLQGDLHMMTQLHGESVERQKELMRLTPEEKIDLQARENVYRWGVTAMHWEEVQTQQLLAKVGNNYPEHEKNYLAKQKKLSLKEIKRNRDDTLAYTAHWIARHAKNALVFYAGVEEHIPMDEESTLRYNALVEELEKTLSLLRAAREWWQGNSSKNYTEYQLSIVNLVKFTPEYKRFAKVELPLEVQNFLKTLDF